MRRRRAAGTVVAVMAVLGACTVGSEPPDESGDLRGGRVEVLAVWAGVERAAFEEVLRGFEEQTGASVLYTSATDGVATTLEARLAEGRLPDVAFLPQPGLLRRYAREGRLVAIDDVVGAAVERNFSPVWSGLGSEGGRLYGVWFKAANKSVVWYDVATFERLGLVPPEDLDGLLSVAGRLADAGVAPFSVAGGAGWTLTDWFENLYLRTAGPERYDRLAHHELPWTDESVKHALRLLDRLLDARFVAGGVERALATSFEPSVQQVFADPSMAAMTMEGDFVAGVVRGTTEAEVGVDADAFPFPRAARAGDEPAAASGATAVMGGGDAAVLFRRSAAGEAFLRFLATPEAAARWAGQGGFLSPNRNLDLAVYPDDLGRSLARSLLEAGDAFRFDLSDLVPAAFGANEGEGMRAALQQFLAARDVDATAARLEAEAAAAFGQ